MRTLRFIVATTLLLALPPSLGSAARERAVPRRVTILPQTEGGAPLTIKVGVPTRLTARLELDDGRTIPLDEHVTWSASDPSVLRFERGAGTRAGTVTPLKKGVVSVTIVYPPVSGASVPYPPDRRLGDAVTVVVRDP